MLYVRLGVSMILSLFGSRIVLSQLGVNDYGIYGLIGGIVAIFTIINQSMSGATSRFLTVSLTKDDEPIQNRTFCTAMIIHLIIAGIVLLLAETAGLWFVSNKLNISPDRMAAAHWVYQLSIISCLISITQVPYNALLISHEKMDVYAIVEIVNAFLKFGVALLLFLHIFDSLIFYAIAILTVSFIIVLIYRIYCIHHFKESQFRWQWSEDIGPSMLRYSGWNVYSIGCFNARQQGINIFLNLFGGTAVNAAASLTYTVQGVVDQLSTLIMMAARPQIIAQCALKNYQEMIALMKDMSILMNTLFLIIGIPLFFEMDYILHLWLGQVPPYTVPFSRCILLIAFINVNNNLLYIPIQGNGEVKSYAIYSGTCAILTLPIIYIIFKHGYSLIWGFGISVISTILNYAICSTLVKKYVSIFKPSHFFLSTLGKEVLFAIPPILLLIVIHNFFSPSIWRVFLTSTISIGILCALVILFGLTKSQSQMALSIFKKKLKI